MGRSTRYSLVMAAVCGCLAVWPLASRAGIAGDGEDKASKWSKRVHPPIPIGSARTSPWSIAMLQASRRSHVGVARAVSPHALPQTVREYTSPVWDLPEANVFEGCPHQCELIEVGRQNSGRGIETIGRGVLTMERAVDVRSCSGTQFPTRGLPSPEGIVHEWGTRDDGLGDVRAMAFGKSLETSSGVRGG